MPLLEKHERHRIRVTLNGRPEEGEAEPNMLLSDFLRQRLGATGTHVGCEHGVCGACTVRVDGRAVRACLYLAVQADGRQITTIEGLGNADGSLGVLQEAFHRNFALQCGFCTPGFLMSLDEILERNPEPGEAELREALSGNMCRCTGYDEIVRAGLEAAAELRRRKQGEAE
jgi:2-furoyl-CoA dehydrogenase 2Fe-2S iron sulfur subunit